MRGTEVIFEAALEAGPQLSSVVITSSSAAVVDTPSPPGYEFTEKDFATGALNKATKDKADGVKTPVSLLYAASKTAAERAVWKFKDEHNVSPFQSESSFLYTNDTLATIFNLHSKPKRGDRSPVGPRRFPIRAQRDLATNLQHSIWISNADPS